MTCKWLMTIVIVSPLSRATFPVPNGLSMAYKWGLLTTYQLGDPPSKNPNSSCGMQVPKSFLFVVVHWKPIL